MSVKGESMRRSWVLPTGTSTVAVRFAAVICNSRCALAASMAAGVISQADATMATVATLVKAGAPLRHPLLLPASYATGRSLRHGAFDC
jgi:hypothetical protein